mmetsp:Transcript_22854/g.23802  ORF Transcript_22854/g.23802 Transcript_22854/m.23802 type:complete len:240 (-) Transcript_22854:82-801(-)
MTSKKVETLPGTYIVEKILNKRTKKGKAEYFVKWEGYSDNDNTWEPISHLLNVKYLITDFEESLKSRKSVKIESAGPSLLLNKKRKTVSSGESANDTNISSQPQSKEANCTDNKKSTLDLDSKNHPIQYGKQSLLLSEENENVESQIKSNLCTEEKEFKDQPSSQNDEAIQGNLDIDKPIRVLDVTLIDEDMKVFNCLVEFDTNSEGIKPANSWVFSDVLRLKSPIIFLDYLLSKVLFK